MQCERPVTLPSAVNDGGCEGVGGGTGENAALDLSKKIDNESKQHRVGI